MICGYTELWEFKWVELLPMQRRVVLCGSVAQVKEWEEGLLNALLLHAVCLLLLCYGQDLSKGRGGV